MAISCEKHNGPDLTSGLCRQPADNPLAAMQLISRNRAAESLLIDVKVPLPDTCHATLDMCTCFWACSRLWPMTGWWTDGMQAASGRLPCAGRGHWQDTRTHLEEKRSTDSAPHLLRWNTRVYDWCLPFGRSLIVDDRTNDDMSYSSKFALDHVLASRILTLFYRLEYHRR